MRQNATEPKHALDARGFSQREKRYQVEAVALRQPARVQRAIPETTV